MNRHGERLLSEDDGGVGHAAECSSMRTAGPATGPAHAFFELGAHPFDMLPPCLVLLDGDGPADPLVARERGDVFPSCQCVCVGGERLAEIGGKVMYYSSGDSNGGHKVLSQLKDENLIREYNPSFGTIAGELAGTNAPVHDDGHVSADRGVARRGREPVLRVVQADGGFTTITNGRYLEFLPPDWRRTAQRWADKCTDLNLAFALAFFFSPNVHCFAHARL